MQVGEFRDSGVLRGHGSSMTFPEIMTCASLLSGYSWLIPFYIANKLIELKGKVLGTFDLEWVRNTGDNMDLPLASEVAGGRRSR